MLQRSSSPQAGTCVCGCVGDMVALGVIASGIVFAARERLGRAQMEVRPHAPAQQTREQPPLGARLGQADGHGGAARALGLMIVWHGEAALVTQLLQCLHTTRNEIHAQPSMRHQAAGVATGKLVLGTQPLHTCAQPEAPAFLATRLPKNSHFGDGKTAGNQSSHHQRVLVRGDLPQCLRHCQRLLVGPRPLGCGEWRAEFDKQSRGGCATVRRWVCHRQRPLSWNV